MRGKRWRRYKSLPISERYTVRPYQASVTVTVPGCDALGTFSSDRVGSSAATRDRSRQSGSDSGALGPKYFLSLILVYCPPILYKGHLKGDHSQDVD